MTEKRQEILDALLKACQDAEVELNCAIRTGVLGETWTAVQNQLAAAIRTATE